MCSASSGSAPDDTCTERRSTNSHARSEGS